MGDEVRVCTLPASTIGLFSGVEIPPGGLDHRDASYRSAFGKRLIDQPLMRNVLADLALESEAATALSLRLARAFDAQTDEAESLLRRVLTPAAKYWICKRDPAVAAEAMEVLGGNGYVEEGVMARIYRQMPLNSIWEGSGNIMCLDILRAFGKHPRCLEVLAAEIEPAVGRDVRLDRFVARLKDEMRKPDNIEARARAITQGIALAVQAGLLVRFAPGYVADAFCAVCPRMLRSAAALSARCRATRISPRYSRAPGMSTRYLPGGLFSASQPRDQLQVFGVGSTRRGIKFELIDPSVVADLALVNRSQTNKPLQAPVDRRRRAELQQEQALDGQRTSSLLVIADLGNKYTVQRGLKVGEMLMLEPLQPAELFKHAARMITPNPRDTRINCRSQ